MKNLIKKSVNNDLPLLLFGKSGWGKTSLVEQVGEELGLEVVKLSLALCLPEDIGGIPSPNGDSFKYLLPDWFYSRKDKEFILFLDEINQSSPQVLHAIYSLVLEKRLHSVTNSKMRIVAAGNLEDENVHLTEIMQPLLNRFYVVDFIHNEQTALDHLNNKYGLDLKELESNPRDIEQAYFAFKAGLNELAINKSGLATIRAFEKYNGDITEADNLIKDIQTEKVRDNNGFI